MNNFLFGFAAGGIFWVFMVFLILSFDNYSSAQRNNIKERAVEMKMATYHPTTGKIVWDREDVKYVIFGETE